MFSNTFKIIKLCTPEAYGSGNLCTIAGAPASRQNGYMHARVTWQSCFQSYLLYVSEVTQTADFTSPHMWYPPF